MRITQTTGYALKVSLLAFAIAICIALIGPREVSAAAEVGIAGLDCDSDPEVIELTNSGDESQDMTGWRLVSDPVADESYDLAPLGTLAAGSSVFIESNSAAEATFTWSTDEILRNGDATDFVRLVDPNGATISEESCTAGGQATQSPTAAPDSPTPTTDVVPNGGGPPAAADTVLTPITAVVAGASLAAVGGATVLGLWLTGAASLWKPRELTTYEPPPPPSAPAPRRRSRPSQAASEPILIVLVIALVGAIILMLLVPASGRTK